MIYRNFVLYQGYAEDQSQVCLTLTHNKGFETAEEAMEDWYAFLLSHAEQEYVPQPKACCLESPKGVFCSTCGNRLSNIDKTAESFVPGLWESIWTGTNDDLGILWEDMDETGWSFWEFPKDGPIITICRFERFVIREDGECEDDLMSFLPGD